MNRKLLHRDDAIIDEAVCLPIGLVMTQLQNASDPLEQVNSKTKAAPKAKSFF